MPLQNYNLTDNDRFHNFKADYPARALANALNAGVITPEDAKLIKNICSWTADHELNQGKKDPQIHLNADSDSSVYRSVQIQHNRWYVSWNPGDNLGKFNTRAPIFSRLEIISYSGCQDILPLAYRE